MTTTRISNLTPHPVSVRVGESSRVFNPAERPARVAQAYQPAGAGNLEGIPLVRSEFGAVDGLPAPAPGVYFIVSRLVAEAARRAGRQVSDLLIPTNFVRDDKGRILACQGFEVL